MIAGKSPKEDPQSEEDPEDLDNKLNRKCLINLEEMEEMES